MTQLVTPSDTAPSDRLTPSEAPPAESAAEQSRPLAGDEATGPDALQEPAWPEWALAEAALQSEPWWRRHLLVVALMVLLVAQAVLLGWLWWANGRQWRLMPQTTASTELTSEPSGALIVIDGVARGTTPASLELDPGAHQLEVKGQVSAWTQRLDLRPGATFTLHFVESAKEETPSQPRLTGALEITTEPAGLAVTVDGQPHGVSPISVTGLEPGSHEVSVTRGPTVVRRTVSVGAGASTAVLISTVGSGIASGWLTVTAPVPVRILENGTLIGSSDTPRLLVPVGRHDLEFSNDTFGYRVTRAVQVAAGQTATVALEPVTGTLSVNAQPWGEVWIDGRRIGETPIGNLPLAIGNHELVVRHPQLGERRRTVAVSVNTPARVGIDMRQ